MFNDRRIPSVDQSVLASILQAKLQNFPNKECIRFHDETVWSYKDAFILGNKVANALNEKGIKKGDIVLVWLPSGPEAVAALFGIALIGAVYMPLNLASKGKLLEQAIKLSDARIIIADAILIPHLQDIETGDISKAIIIGSSGASPLLENIELDYNLYSDNDNVVATEIMPWETAMIIMTSGTTGPSKGVLVSHIQLYTTAINAMGHVTDNDIILSHGALNHIAGLSCLYIAVIRGATLVLEQRWRTEKVWQLIAQHKVTTMGLLGSVMQFLLNQSVTPEEKDNTLKKIYLVPLVGDIDAIRQRFDIDIYSVWNMTETSVPLITDDNVTVNGLCGKARKGMQLRLVDDNDCEVKLGDVGELIIRADCPWEISIGYYKNDKATVALWRNGWFHTGDAMTQDAEGNFYFVDRKRDCIRRRGENISSYEIETVTIEFPDIDNAAAIAVPSEYTEDEVLVVIELRPGRDVEPSKLLLYLADKLPYFMVPRYIWVVDNMPLTNTNKVRKNILRDEWMLAEVWDREAHEALRNNKWRRLRRLQSGGGAPDTNTGGAVGSF